jgi:hypothetical protein
MNLLLDFGKVVWLKNYVGSNGYFSMKPARGAYREESSHLELGCF